MRRISLLLASFLLMSSGTTVYADSSNDGGSQPVANATVIADDLNVRQGPSIDADILSVLTYGTNVQVLDAGDHWSKIKINDTIAYVAKKYLSFDQGGLASRGNGMVSSRLLNITESLLGTPYQYGGTTPDGFDCSGFTSYVMGQLGVNLPRTSSDQFYTGTRVSRDDLRVGDLLFFSTSRSGGVNHVGIYIGNNKMVHAATKDVEISDLDWYFTHYTYLGARRVLNE